MEFYTRERYFGHFRRTMSLPAGIDAGDIDASFENGLLEVSVTGGADHPEPDRIQIRSR